MLFAGYQILQPCQIKRNIHLIARDNALTPFTITAFLESCTFPPTVCTGEFLEELEFWGVKAEKLEKCCHHRYVLFMREQENLRGFINCTEKEEDQNDAAEKFQNNGAKSRLWNILENRDSKLETKVCSG